jgi:hypothetical protein
MHYSKNPRIKEYILYCTTALEPQIKDWHTHTLKSFLLYRPWRP